MLTSSYPRFPGDGAAPFIRSIAEALTNLGHAVAVVAPYDTSVATKTATSSVLLYRFRYVWPPQWHIVGHGRSLVDDRRLRQMAILLLPLYVLVALFSVLVTSVQQQADWLQAHWLLPNGPIIALVAWIQRKPFIVSLHGSDGFVARRNKVFATVARWTLRRATLVTACSPELRDIALALGAEPRRTQVWLYGVNTHLFRPAVDMRSTYRKHWGWTDDDKVIVAAGRLVSKKGFGVLLEAMLPILNKKASARLAIAGAGPLRHVLEQQACSAGIAARVQFTGQIAWDEMHMFLAAADVFALPSVRDESGNMDGLPTIALEAMACGLPVVASRLGGIPMVLEHGRSGYLVAARDSAALAKALLTLLCNDEQRRQCGLAARKVTETRLPWEIIVTQLTTWLSTTTEL
jgi:glycosyltransferase involved in cell wall biosynthesis